MNFEKLLKSFWKLQIGGWLIYLVLIYITFLSIAAEGSFLRLLEIKTVRTIIGFALTCILWQFYKRIINRFSLGKIVAIVVISSVIFGILWTAIESLYGILTNPNYNFYAILPRMPRIALDYFVTVMAWSAIYFGVKYWREWQTERENALQAKILAEKAQLEMLRYQLNPHFLFNALNSIRASVEEDKTRAKQMITQLSEFLRHSLLTGKKREIPLREEIEAVKNYLAIEKIRFEEKLEVKFDIENAAEDFKIPYFLLNPLVENAVKHGLQTSEKPLKIQISAKIIEDKLFLEVANSGKLSEKFDSNGTKIGLKNVRERLEKLFPEKSSFAIFQNNGFVRAQIEIEE